MNALKTASSFLIISSFFFVTACTSTPNKVQTPFKATSSKDVEIVWAAGMHGLDRDLGLAGSCPIPEYLPHEIPSNLGVGFGVCFVPKIIGAHKTLGVLYTITLPGEGTINPNTNEKVKQVKAMTRCFNGQQCFGGYLPSQYELLPGEWLIEFNIIGRKIIEHSFIIQKPAQ